MKLNTLLLTSAATLMATSVSFAADLPSKKAAPSAGSVQVCKVGGMTGFVMPDTGVCIDIGGRVTYDAGYTDGKADGVFVKGITADGMGFDPETPEDYDGDADFYQGAGYRVHFDARSNSEYGVVRSFIQLTDDSGYTVTRRAFIQVGGLTVGVKDSITDIVGTTPVNPGTGFDAGSTGADYQVAVGGLNFGIGLEQGAGITRNRTGALTSLGEGSVSEVSDSYPDLVLHLSGTAGAVGFAVAGAFHTATDFDEDSTHNGYAVIGRLNIQQGEFGARIWGAMSDGASEYTGNYRNTAGDAVVSTLADFYDDGTDSASLKGSAFGGEVTFNVSKSTQVYALARQNTHSVDVTAVGSAPVDMGDAKWTETQYGFGIAHTLAKGLTITPEYWRTEGEMENVGGARGAEGKYSSNNFYVRIQRDF